MRNKLLVILGFLLVSWSACKKKEVEPVEPNPPVTPTQPWDAHTNLPNFKLVSLDQSQLPSQIEWFKGSLIGVSYESFKNYIVQSTDNGVTWKRLLGAGNNGSAILAKTMQKLYIANDKVLQSSTNGTSWSLVTTNFDFNTYQLDKFKANDKFLVITSSNLGRSKYYTHVSTDGGSSFKLANSSSKISNHLLLTNNAIWMIRNDSLLCSKDSGNSFQKINIPVNSFYRAKAFDNVISFEGDQDYYSLDEGNTWINNTKRIFPFGRLYDGQLLATSTLGSGTNNTYRSSNNGNTWIAFGNTTGSATTSSPTQTWIKGALPIMYYESGYPNWRIIGFPSGKVGDMEFTDRGMYAAVGNAIYYSHDGGKMWDLRQNLGSWPAASCLSIRPDGNVLAVYGGQSGSPRLNIYDYQLLSLLETRTFGIANATCKELLWFEKEGKFLGLFTEHNGDAKYPATSSYLLNKWAVTTQFRLQAGGFLDGTASDLSLFTLIDKTAGKRAQIAFTILPSATAYFWNTTSYKININGQAKSIAYSKSGGKILVQYANNYIYIANNEELSRQWTELEPNETAERIRFDRSNYLWVFTDKGTYKSDVPLLFQ